MWISIPALLLVILRCDRCVLANRIIYKDNQLYEGSFCRLPTGREGVCVSAIECPARVQQILQGDYSADGRCGFRDFEEIFCCAKRVTGRSENREIRPAEAACKRHKEVVWNIDDGNVRPSVINGELAKAGEFPHMAVLGYSVPEEEAAGGIKYTCGGTLISEKHVLTAANCVRNIHGLIPQEVVLGTTDLDETESAHAQRIPISKIIEHPEYRRGLSYCNLAILELEHPVKFTIDVYPTCLMTKPLTKANLNEYNSLVVLGWGEVDLDGSTSTKLVKAEELKFVDKKRCFKRYANVGTNIPNGLDDAMICVRDPNVNGKADTCWGGSGGPLLDSSRKFPTLVGVASFAQACGGNSPGVYVSVYKYLDWIEDHVWPSSD